MPLQEAGRAQVVPTPKTLGALMHELARSPGDGGGVRHPLHCDGTVPWPGAVRTRGKFNVAPCSHYPHRFSNACGCLLAHGGTAPFDGLAGNSKSSTFSFQGLVRRVLPWLWTRPDHDHLAEDTTSRSKLAPVFGSASLVVISEASWLEVDLLVNTGPRVESMAPD
ncbi:hypothetical protein EJB05_37161, partial [Eragrostis curvula]